MAHFRKLFLPLFLISVWVPIAHANETVLRAAGLPQLSNPSAGALKLRGEGVFRYLGMKLYKASFYIDPALAGPDQALKDVPKRLVIRYFRDIPKKALIQAAERNIRNNPSADFKGLRERLDHLHAKYADIKEGDTYELVYFKGNTLLYYNGQLKAQIAGADFASAYFGIWVSEYSISQKLRKALLGFQPSHSKRSG